MSLQHFFLKNQTLTELFATTNSEGIVLELSDDDLHHAHVLRLKSGEHIGVIDADGVYFECEILNIEDQIIVKNSLKQSNSKKEKNIQISLFSGVLKGTKTDDVIRAVTEIGISDFYPIMFDRCVVKLDEKKIKSRVERWRKIAKSASMQSGRLDIPTINNVEKSKNLKDILSNYDIVLACWEESDNIDTLDKLKDIIKDFNTDNISIALIIGPEGGITSKEIEIFKISNNNTHIISLGNTILRAETACLVASTLVKFSTIC